MHGAIPGGEPFAGGFLFDEPVSRVIFVARLQDDSIEHTQHPFPNGWDRIEGVESGGLQIAVGAGRGFSRPGAALTFPAMEVIASHQTGIVRVSLSERLLIVQTPNTRFAQLRYFDGRSSEIESELLDGSAYFLSRGDGFFEVHSSVGLGLMDLRSGRTMTILRSDNLRAGAANLRADKRALRFAAGAGVFLVEIDLERGVAAVPERLLAEIHSQGIGSGFFHPEADLWISAGEIRRFDRTVILRLPPGTRPMKWSDNGRKLLALSGDGVLQIWQ